MYGISIRELLEEHRSNLSLKLVAGRKGIDKRLVIGEVHRPGLALAGFIDLYTYDRLQVLGNTELFYLESLPEEERKGSIETIYQFDLPCVVITNGGEPFPEMVKISDEKGVPLLVTRFATTRFVHLFSFYLDDIFAPQVKLHGSLVDVYGVGLLFTGRSAMGKSEVALDLVERGHRLVADDVVAVTRRSNGVLMGTGIEGLRYHMEIRGLGIVDVKSTFGIRAIRKQKRIEVQVQLAEWDNSEDYERIGLEDNITSILGIEIPVVTVPIFPGKNITVITEVIALNHLLKLDGYHPAKEFNRKLIEIMESKETNLVLEGGQGT
jgi:HPr kinase/phosphorylase